MYAWSTSDRPKKPVKITAPLPTTRKKGKGPVASGAPRGKPVVVGHRSGKYAENMGTWPKAGLTSSQFMRKKNGAFTAEVCKAVGKGRCFANEGYLNGRRSLRFCVKPGQPGHVVDIEGMSPGAVRKLALEACEHFRTHGSWKGSAVGKAALGGVRRRKTKKAAKRSRR